MKRMPSNNKPKQGNTLARLTKDLEALGDENRLRILNLLRNYQEICVCDIYEALDLPQNLASYLLAILKDAGFVISRKQGVKVLYSSAGRKIKSFRKNIVNIFSVNNL